MSSDDMRAIRMRIRERREELGLSYQGLAELTGMSKSTLQRYETGAVSYTHLAWLPLGPRAIPRYKPCLVRPQRP